jgi:hypothetical protein
MLVVQQNTPVGINSKTLPKVPQSICSHGYQDMVRIKESPKVFCVITLMLAVAQELYRCPSGTMAVVGSDFLIRIFVLLGSLGCANGNMNCHAPARFGLEQLVA